MPGRFPIIFSSKPSQTSHSVVDSDAIASSRTRSSTTITTLEMELGMCEPPKSGATASSSLSSLALRLLLNLLYFVCPGLLSKLHIPKRKKPTTQGPEPHQNPFFNGEIWSTFWDCGSDEFDVNLPRSPPKDVGCPPESFPDYHANGEQDSELGQDVTTPTNGTACNSDEELTPLFSSNFTRTPHPNALGAEVTLWRAPGNQRPNSHQA